MFRGASSLNMDSKGRLGVPTKYRDPLRERCAGKLVLTVNNTRERCLWLYPYDEWEQVERKVVDLPSFDASAQAQGTVAYLREFDSSELKERFPDAPDMAPGTKLWAVFAANGTPILLADAQESAVAGAMQNDLTPVSVH